MQYDNIYEIKENKKDNNLKAQNLIVSSQNRVLNNTKIHQPKEEILEKKIKLNLPKMKREREREREITFYLWKKNMNRMEKIIINLW